MADRTYRLEQWAVRADPYKPPEAADVRLTGLRDGVGHRVLTTPILSAVGRVVTTESGSVYKLGEIEPGYLEWMQENGIACDPERPVRVHGR